LTLRCFGDETLDLATLVKRRFPLGKADKLLQVYTVDEFTQGCRHPQVRRQVESRVRDRGRRIFPSMEESDPVGFGIDEVLISAYCGYLFTDVLA
jgi:hypothetical protein